MKKIVFPLFFLLIACGCASFQKETSKDTHASVSPDAEICIDSFPVEEEPQESRTTARRILPSFYMAGDKITITIKVYPLPGTSGVIVEENLPEKWEIKESVPPSRKEQEGNIYKWLIWGTSVEPFEIVYTVEVPEGEKGEREFSGAVITHREKRLPLEGDGVISHYGFSPR